jgi:glycerophosphoryl diester phosphodiesterase
VPSMKIIGHRGYGPTDSNDKDMRYPENTLLAFKHALDNGADGIELDVFLSKDGIPIVIHDRRLHEHVITEQVPLVGGRSVTDFTFDELQQFDVGCGQKIPSLGNVFNLVAAFKDSRVINLDVKDPATIHSILATIDHYKSKGFKHDVVISSYKWDILKELRRRNSDVHLVPAIKTAMLFGADNVGPAPDYTPLTSAYQENFREPILALHQEIGCYAFDCAMPDFTPEIITFASDCKVGLQLSTGMERVNADNTNYDVLRQLQDSLDIGVPFVICKVDEPDLVKKSLPQYIAS